MKTRKIELFKKQIDFIQAPQREVLLDAGIGFGKTKVGCLWLIMMTQKYPGTRWLMVARDVPQLRNAVLHEFKLVCSQWLGWEEGADYDMIKNPTEITFPNGSQIIGVGATNYDSAFRGPSYSGGLFDEVDYYKPEAFLALLGRIRVSPELLRFVSSPKGFNHVYEHFYTKKSDSRHVINATTYDNPTLSNAYIESLKAAYSPRLFEQEVLGKRLRINIGSVYNEFNRERHVRECKRLLDNQTQLYFFTDYNISNYCGVYMFRYGDKTFAWGEEHLKFEGTRKMAEQVRAKFPGRHIVVIGDSAGNNKRDTAADKTNYQIFEEVLGRGSTKSFTNPPVEQRIISANSLFYHDKIVIDPSCKTLIKDLELLAWKEDGSGIDKSNIDLSHASDAYTYGLWYFSPLKPQRKKSRTVML